MSFCCGAGMIGTKGTLKHIRTRIHNVPILFCPVCQRIEVHHLASQEYEILAEYAYGDHATDMDFEDYVDTREPGELFANCISNEESETPLEVVRTQIDMALDLLVLSRRMNDEAWTEQLRERLQVLARRQAKLHRKASEVNG